MLSRRALPVWVGLVFLSGMFLTGQDTWGPQPECVTDADCDNGDVCTHPFCDPVHGCFHECAAFDPLDPCCEDPACTGSPLCGGPGQDVIPDTGITACYNTTMAIECPAPGHSFYGQDAQYTNNPMSYTENGNGTVTDNVTGLVWQQCPAGLSGSYCSVGTVEARNWVDATSYCEGLVLAGHTAWRLPDRYELQGIVNYGRQDPAIDSAVFPGTRSRSYWSSTHDDGIGSAWYVSFNMGYVGSTTKAAAYDVRCVR